MSVRGKRDRDRAHQSAAEWENEGLGMREPGSGSRIATAARLVVDVSHGLWKSDRTTSSKKTLRSGYTDPPFVFWAFVLGRESIVGNMAFRGVARRVCVKVILEKSNLMYRPWGNPQGILASILIAH